MRKRNKFSLSYYQLGTCKMGYMLPIGLTEVLPGDSVRHSTSVFLRLAPMLAPVMHPVQVKIHHWYVPLRLLWDEFEDFITGGPDGLNVSEFPTVTSPTGGFATGSLADYLGLPPKIAGLEVSALPFRAYNLIYNEWYRDQDLESELAISKDSGADTTTSLALMRGDWERDYFTTARPWPQKGLAVTVPVQSPAGAATIVSDGTVPSFNARMVQNSTGAVQNMPVSLGLLGFDNSITGTTTGVRNAQKVTQTAFTGSNYDVQGALNFVGSRQLHSGNGDFWRADGAHPATFANSGLKLQSDSYGDIGHVDINQLREAFALQRFEEHRAMYGSRYVEYLRYLGIKASDARLQRPEYLGGGKQTIQFSEVLQTAEGSDPVGTLRGHGIAAMRSNRYRRFFEEHGYVVSVMMIRPKSIYMQGVPRTWLRRVKEDFWQRELQHIGQQEVYTKELYGAAANDADGSMKVFGYQNRYDEYRQHESYVTSEFRDILNYWHMARDFANEPALNADFISSVPTERIFAAQQNDQIYYMANHSMQARRLMAQYGNPI